jgi:hypothetical protein
MFGGVFARLDFRESITPRIGMLLFVPIPTAQFPLVVLELVDVASIIGHVAREPTIRHHVACSEFASSCKQDALACTISVTVFERCHSAWPNWIGHKVAS